MLKWRTGHALLMVIASPCSHSVCNSRFTHVADDMQLDELTDTYSHTCRCSGTYKITCDQLSEVLTVQSILVSTMPDDILKCGGVHMLR